jgi:two-component system LytT family response regulator
MSTTIINTIIVDDDATARQSLKKIIEENFPQVSIVAEAGDVPNAVKLIHAHKPDLVFLDIDMPGHTGLELPDFFDKSQINFKIVFITAFTEYALNAFELSAIDYILKPAGKDQIERALQKITPQSAQQLNVLKDNLSDGSRKIALQTSEGLLFIPINEILYLKADGSYTYLHLENNTKHTFSKRLSEFAALEKTGLFMRIHRSHIINLNRIKKIEKGQIAQLTMDDNTELPISSEKRHALMEYVERFKL